MSQKKKKNKNKKKNKKDGGGGGGEGEEEEEEEEEECFSSFSYARKFRLQSYSPCLDPSNNTWCTSYGTPR